MFRFHSAVLVWCLLTAVASAEIDGSSKLVIDFTQPEEAAKHATWSDPKNLGCTTAGFGWDGEKRASRDGWLETEPLAVGTNTLAPQHVILQVKLQTNYPALDAPAPGAITFNTPSIFVRHSADRVHWTDWQELDMREDPRAKGSVIYTTTVGVPLRAITPYHAKLREWTRREETNWVSDHDEFCRWLVKQDPTYFAKNRPFVGYVQFLVDGSFRSGQRITRFEAEGGWVVSGIHQPPKNPDAVIREGKTGAWSFRGVETNQNKKEEPPKRAASAADAPPAETNAGPQLGVYRWTVKPANLDAFAEWLGQPTVWAVDFIGGESWDNVQWPTWWLEGWGPWVRAKPGRRLVLAVPILAGPPDRSGPTQGTKDTKIPVSLADGAAGKYNHHFKQLAENLVAHKLTDTILRPGWEFNGGWYAWGAKGNAKEFAAYWRQIVTTMRAVPGAEGLKFCWNPTLGDQDFPADEAWPGAEYVDFVGVDVYDETWNKETYPWPADASAEEIRARHRKVWDEWIMASPRGLAFWTKFAAQHDKPLAIPEWGLNRRKDGHAGGDNPLFIERMHAFVNDPANRVAFHCYFDVNVAGDDHRHQLSPGLDEKDKPDQTEFPNSAAVFKKLFGGKR